MKVESGFDAKLSRLLRLLSLYVPSVTEFAALGGFADVGVDSPYA